MNFSRKRTSFKGYVTKIEPKLASITLENSITVFLGQYFENFEDSEIRLPALNAYVTITKGIISVDKVLFPYKLDCEYYCGEAVNKICLNYVKLLRKCGLTMLDTIYLSEILNSYKNSPRFCTDWLENIKRLDFNHENSIFKWLPYVKNNITVKSLFNKTDFSFTTPSDYKLENSAILKKFSYKFSVNNYENNFLIGYLHVSNDHGGYLIISDSHHHLICQFLADDHAELSEKTSKLLNNFVLIHNYRIFADYIKYSHTLQSLIVNIKYARILSPKKDSKQVEQNFKFCIKIKVISRFSILYNQKFNSKDCDILCSAKPYTNNEYKKCFFRLKLNCLENYPILNSDDTYVLLTNNSKIYEDLESGLSENYLTFNNERIPCYYFPKDAKLILQNVRDFSIERQYLSVDELIDRIENNLSSQQSGTENTPDNELISFEGIVHKRFTENDDYKHNQYKVDDMYFGIRGKKIHKINFKSCELKSDSLDEDNFEEEKFIYHENRITNDEKERYEVVALILRNMRNILRPSLLIPGMHVRIGYISWSPNKKYFIPNMYTTFEIIDYMPDKEFESTPELLGNKNWGPPSKLSQSKHIPYSCLVWGQALTITLKKLNINIECNKCNRNYSTLQQICCENSERSGQWDPKLKITCAAQVNDDFGTYDFLTTEMRFFKIIFNLNDIEFRIFRRCFAILKTWNCNQDYKYDEELNSCPMRHGKKLFGEFLDISFKVFNLQKIHNLDLKCRILTKEKRDGDRHKFFLVEARKSKKSDILRTF